jgi:prepilin-type N-terminal cleavage/methylation domain-containing protein/prepilin-type processing-associated H-X9-DG protein
MIARRLASRFTLIELLVVIAIIAILASMLLPALGSARQQGYKIACIGNLHQLGTALAMYGEDHNGVVPFAISGIEGTPSMTSWDYVLSSYVGENITIAEPSCMTDASRASPVFRCPSDKEQRAAAGYAARSYCRVMFDDLSYPDYYDGIRLNQVSKPSAKFLLIEWHHANNFRGSNWQAYANRWLFTNQGGVSSWHTPLFGLFHQGNSSNFLFCDFHVGNVGMNEASDDTHWTQN